MLPRIILHNAASLDGRLDWIAPDLGRFYELASRWREDATLVGSNTILAEEAPPEDEMDLIPPVVKSDDPRPLLVVPDSWGRVHSWHHLRKQGHWKGMVALVSSSTPHKYLDYLKKRSIDYVIAGKEKVDLREALEELNLRYRVDTVRVDSGGTLNGVLLRGGLVDEISLLVHPVLVGGTSSRSFFRAADLGSAEGVIRLKLTHAEGLAEDVVWLRYKVIKTEEVAADDTPAG
jgi:2,5-diamino-6-(ribosylamino)-4(3H)-pyrimidinone 5'-phosphate reductase